jgi:hypothetical protein
MTLAVLVRSVPVALAIGIAWAGPFEHLLQDAWDPANRLFPGLLLEAFVAGGTTDVSASRALLTVTVYLAIAATIAATTFGAARCDRVGRSRFACGEAKASACGAVMRQVLARAVAWG